MGTLVNHIFLVSRMLLHNYDSAKSRVVGVDFHMNPYTIEAASKTAKQVRHELMELPPGLRELTIRHTNAEELPVLQESIRYLEIEQCPLLKYVPSLPSGLRVCRLYGVGRLTLPHLPTSLLELYIHNGDVLHSVTYLPPRLRVLIVVNDHSVATTLPPLPPTLCSLFLSDTNISSLPSLPPALKELTIKHTPVLVLPPLPASLTTLAAEEVLLQREVCESIADYEERWIPVRERIAEEESRARCMERCDFFKEDLMIRTWRGDWMMDWCLDEEEKSDWRLYDC